MWQERNAYGLGRTFRAWAWHFWKVAVPDKGVNNAYDYPLGLPYLLALIPFCAIFFFYFKQRRLSWAALAVVLLWAAWWMGSQQARWLYLPLILLFILTFNALDCHDLLSTSLVISLALTNISIFRAYKMDLKPGTVLRQEDNALLAASRRQNSSFPLNVSTKEVAYSESLVNVTQGSAEWILSSCQQ